MGSSIGKIFGTSGLLSVAFGGPLETVAAGVGIKKLWDKDKKKKSSSTTATPATETPAQSDSTTPVNEDIQWLGYQDETEEKLKKRKLLGGY